ncbi:DUF3768 domain-containing protein [Ruegeria atlantica]|uniref:DUF3768 domain-containing protein n=1 Tax=Ruegeria atlantica TaxID=81569 RepID=UPI00147C882A|nr:DUF3768 domain-containing protein [Ruegeria atlantica]
MAGNGSISGANQSIAVSRVHKNRTLNDTFRKSGADGIVMISMGIHNLGRAEVDTIVKQLGGKVGDDSCEAGSEHDFGEIRVNNRPVHWEINYYNKDLDDDSPDSTNPEKTTRLMTLLLGSEL